MKRLVNMLDEYPQELLSDFLVELLQRTDDAPLPAEFREKAEAFVDELLPWVGLSKTSKTRLMFAVYTIIGSMHSAGNGDVAGRVPLPEGRILLDAWLRRRHYNPILYGRTN